MEVVVQQAALECFVWEGVFERFSWSDQDKVIVLVYVVGMEFCFYHFLDDMASVYEFEEYDLEWGVMLWC